MQCGKEAARTDSPIQSQQSNLNYYYATHSTTSCQIYIIIVNNEKQKLPSAACFNFLQSVCMAGVAEHMLIQK